MSSMSPRARTGQTSPSLVTLRCGVQIESGAGGRVGRWLGVRVGLRLGYPLPVPLLRPAVLLGLACGEQAVGAGVLQEELDGGLHVLDEVWRLGRRGGG